MQRATLACAIAAVLASAAEGALAAEPVNALDEIVVTAQRRSENIQDVPISIQALTSQTISQLNITTFDDYIKFLPNVTSASSGPGQNEVFMRGLSAGSQASQGSAATGLWPNVAIYLDNQSGQMPNRNLDVYAADLNRIEVLEGPQGTLFGSGAEAGVIRYITNEPKLDKTEGSFKMGYGVTAHGDPNSELQAVLNLPLLTDRMAIRGVFYNDHRGGYIDNVSATFTRKNTDIGIHYANYPADANGLYRRLPAAQGRAGRRLHELLARRLLRLLPVLRPRQRWRQFTDLHLLLAVQLLAYIGAQRTPAARAALQHAGRLAPARHRRCVLGGQRPL